MKVENEFNVGFAKNLTPWIDTLEKESSKQLEKPDNFDHAMEIEKQAVVFAKEVRKANKLMQTLENSVEQLPENKMWAGQQIRKVSFMHAYFSSPSLFSLVPNWLLQNICMLDGTCVLVSRN